ncbi:AAA family ATPase [Saccharibacillus sp. CPCC 101409]|uniref:McrB family protein n=1 Tax=Saccharibacillus sp. CPCC 101409 TaxID=3058041 RepID=UPI002672779E|nr:AAA family ATPase [Saccharibacillus sp. CPCC 101409]MDO3408417.1 AAA family ATPase [Saccharibacillus sp. CPCC 101409]
MIKQHGSWWKDERIAGLIARIEVEAGMFEYGFEIPAEFHADFAEAGGGVFPAAGESRPVHLMHQTGDVYAAYEVRMERRRIGFRGGEALEIHYDSNKELKRFLASAFHATRGGLPPGEDGGTAEEDGTSGESSRAIRPGGAEEAEAALLEAAPRTGQSGPAETGAGLRIPARRDPGGGTDSDKLREERAEYVYFYRTDTPYTYRMELETLADRQAPRVWWAEHGAALERESALGLLWTAEDGRAAGAGQGRRAPQARAEAAAALARLRPGDVVLHSERGELRFAGRVAEAAARADDPLAPAGLPGRGSGLRVRVDYRRLNPAVRLEGLDAEPAFLRAARELSAPSAADNASLPLRLHEFAPEELEALLRACPRTDWPDFVRGAAETGREDGGPPPFDPDNSIERLSAGPPAPEPAEPPLPHIPDREVSAAVRQVAGYIRQKGFSFPDGLVEHYYLSLKTRPFVILAGISGTGKTQLSRLFAEAVGASADNGRFTLIPVRPDWSDPADLIGYKDLSGAFKPGPLTLALRRASLPGEADRPHFIVLDEMNLARVEHYFSDLLSLMETRRRPAGRREAEERERSGRPGNEISSQPLLPEELFEREADRAAYGGLTIPGNVYLIGTVNMDETTYPFSKKVLDRAGTIEFNHIDLMQLPLLREEAQEELFPLRADRHLLQSDYLQLIDAMDEHGDLIRVTAAELAQINTVLEDIQAHVGFRVRDAVCFYLIYNERFRLMARDAAFDGQLMQKILPRIQGSRFAVKRVLLDLLRHCLGSEAAGAFDWRELEDSAEDVYAGRRGREALAAARYPQSAKKLAYMLRRLDEDGFTSYWLS